jgi:spore maturation protein CgeB
VKVLYVALKYNYGQPSQGYSYEHYNFYHALVRMGHDILYFDMMLMQHGRESMNQRLLEVAKNEKPDLMFTVLHTNELEQSVVREISESPDTVTLNWFCDDQWRFDNYSRYWAPCFNGVITTAPSALPKYAHLGYSGVIKSQWACNHFLYRKLDLPLKYDVTFVGQPHGNRREIIQSLRDAGINVHAWGNGWKSGRLSQEEMIRVFNQSRINLNLSKVSTPDTGDDQNPEQIKGRSFEIPGCGGFQLSGSAEDLNHYYEIDKEIVCFEDVDDLREKVYYYLSNEDERAAIAQAGYQRTLREHTYVHRFANIFKRLGLPSKPPHEILKGDVCLSRTMELRARSSSQIRTRLA